MTFKETVERLRADRGTSGLADDLAARWNVEVSRLYDLIADWLSPYITNGDIVLQRSTKTAEEERIGLYEIEELDIEVGNEVIRLSPRGTIVIGARGRIDMSHLGSGNPTLLVLVGSEDHPEWAIVDRTRRSALTPLTKDTFETALNDLLVEYDASSGLKI